MKFNGKRQGGYTFAELAIGMAILVTGAVVLANHLSVNYTATQTQRGRVFAFTKAQALLSEIQSYVDRGEINAAIDLDGLDDGVVPKPTLTITTQGSSLVAPDHALSGNIQRDGQWVWSRLISVKPFQGLDNRNVRYVTVRIYKRDRNGKNRSMASLSSVVNSVGSGFPTTQVFDVYLFAVENIPGWWVFMEAIIPFVESAITDLESRNPGLKMRTHWITKASYGRNEVYRPLVNEALDSNQPVHSVYWYPGMMPSGSASGFYYVPDLMKARLSFDGTERGGYHADTNPYPYALADFYNHAMRYPREKALHDQRIAAVKARKAAIALAKRNNNPVPDELHDMSEEPTLRLFLEDLATDPDKYDSALVINLHGELIPMPSLRNYSDSARLPDNAATANQRVVTHPEELRTKRKDIVDNQTDDVWLRVYAYMTDPALAPASGVTGLPIAIQVMGIDLTDPAAPNGLIADAALLNLRGGVDILGDREYRPFADSRLGPGATNEMYHEVTFVDPGAGEEKYTLILLHNTPLVAPYVEDSAFPGTWQGLNANKRSRLYNLEYVPACTEAGLDFSRDLSAKGDGPKNTARWRLKIPKESFSKLRFVDPTGNYYNPDANVVVKVRTRFWDTALADPLQSGTMYPAPIQPDNLSETYTWWADSREAVPITERSQFQGDPRHNPYKDLWNGDADFGNGYNWYHDALNNDAEDGRADYPGIHGIRLRNRWQAAMRQDVPRFFELLRTGLINSNAVYTTLTGFSYYYMGHGNEIGYDAANGYPSSIPVNVGPWSTTTAATSYMNNITWYRCYVRSADWPYWWGMPWLGELYRDSVYATQWVGLDADGKPKGNLDCGNGAVANRFLRWHDYSTYYYSNNWAYGTRMYQAYQRTSTKGCTSFFNIFNSPGTFTHFFSSGNGTLIDAGLDLRDNYNFPMPDTAPINRPWSIASGAAGAEEYGFDPYSTTRSTAVMVKRYYNHPTGYDGSGVVQLRNKDNTAGCYVIVNGISNAVASGSSFIAKYSILTMVQSFFEGGDPALLHRIRMPPRVEIESPTEVTELADPTSIQVKFGVDWRRWDGQKYTSSMTTAFSEPETDLEYVITYSRDSGATWLHVQDDTSATPGEKPTLALYLVPDQGNGAETYDWSTPSSQFPEGSYLVRIECYRKGQTLHYSQHQVKVYIER